LKINFIWPVQSITLRRALSTEVFLERVSDGNLSHAWSVEVLPPRPGGGAAAGGAGSAA
jgi:hypothetical protein